MVFAQLTYRESPRDIEVCLWAQTTKRYHMGSRHDIKRSTPADDNGTRNSRNYAEFAQRLNAQARTLYARDSFGIELQNTCYVPDSTTIDRCRSLLPWALFRIAKSAVKIHTLLNWHGNSTSFIHIPEGKHYSGIQGDTIKLCHRPRLGDARRNGKILSLMEIQMYFFFDTETTGIPKNYKAPASDLKNWPRLVQLAWLVADDAGNEITSAEHIVKPVGYTIPAAASKVHGITTEHALRDGLEIRQVLDLAVKDISAASLLIAHNVAFDEKIVGCELLRAGYPNHVEAKPRRCTMQSSTDYCRIPGPYGNKWPTLQELHRKLFKEDFTGAHRALADVRACARCYFELRRLKVMT